MSLKGQISITTTMTNITTTTTNTTAKEDNQITEKEVLLKKEGTVETNNTEAKVLAGETSARAAVEAEVLETMKVRLLRM